MKAKGRTQKVGDEDKSPATREWMSVRDIARRWRVSISAVYGLRAGTSSLKRYRFGSSIRFLAQDVIAFEQEVLNQGKKH